MLETLVFCGLVIKLFVLPDSLIGLVEKTVKLLKRKLWKMNSKKWNRMIRTSINEKWKKKSYWR